MSNSELPSFLSGANERDIVPLPLKRATHFYEHVNAPDKLLRLGEQAYGARGVFPYFKKYLQDLEANYDIPTVHPEFVVGAEPLSPHAAALGMKPKIEVLTVVDRVDGIPAEELLKQESMDASVVQEFDLLSQRMVAQLRDVYTTGGFHCQDIYRYGQFMYDEIAPPSERLVLVDVEPLGFCFNKPPQERLAGSIPVKIVEAIADITEDVVGLENKIGRQLNVGAEIVDFIESIDSNGFVSMEEAKLRILRALEEQDTQWLSAFEDEEERLLANDEFPYDSSGYVDTMLEKGDTI